MGSSTPEGSARPEVEALTRRVAELEVANARAMADVQFLHSMERIGRCMRSESDLEALLRSVLDEILDLFGCDRAWLLYPCDPDAEFWGVPMERTVAEFPGVFALGVQVPMDEGASAVFAEARSVEHCLPFDPTTERQVPEEVGKAFGVRSQLALAIHPHNDKPWLLGLHHCRTEHVFTPLELRTFEGVGKRIAEALDAMLLLRDLRESEQQVTQLQRMQAIGSLAGGVAHDFNNQLLVILCYADLLRSQGGEGGEFLDHVIEAADRATGLTRQLLAFSRRSVLDPRPVDVGRIVQESIGFLARAVGPAIELQAGTRAEGAVANVDPHQLEQVLVNLVTNARDAMPRGGVIQIATSVDRRRTGRPPELGPGAYVRLVVKDAGTGMDEETRRRVFEPFFTTKEHGAGTGLGLSTAYGVARQSGGTLTVESTLGEGSTFTVWLPHTNEVPTDATGGHATVRGEGGTERVVVIDDLAEVADVASRVLRSRGYDVITARSPAEALAAIADRSRQVDLLLTDVVMAGTDGVALAEEALRLLPSLRVTFSTGYSSHVVERLRNAGATRKVLQKPYLPADLLAHVRAVLDA